MKLRIFALLAALLAPSLAFGQATLLQGGSWTPGHVPMYVSPGQGQPVVQDSGPASGGAPGLGLSEQLLVARNPAGTYPAQGVGTGPYGANWCSYDAPITNATGGHYLCLSPNSSNGTALIATGTFGGATPQSLCFSVNGATLLCLPGLPDSGFVTYTGAVTAGDNTCWNQAGVVEDCSALGNTQYALAYFATAGKIASIPLGTNGQLLLGQTSAVASFVSANGDVTSISATGAFVVGAVNGVAYPSSPSVGTAPYVSGTNAVTYGQVPVSGGGTGLATLTAHAILLGEDTGNVGNVLGTLGECLISQGSSADPIFGACSAGGTVSDVDITGGISQGISVSGTCNSTSAINCSLTSFIVQGATAITGSPAAGGLAWNDGGIFAIGASITSNDIVTGGGTGSAPQDSGFTVANAGYYFSSGFVNRFRNGTFDVWQRGTTVTIGTSGNYGPDGWKIYFTGSSSVAAVREALSGGSEYYYLQVQGAASNTDIQIGQRIESYVAAPLANHTVTVQFQFYQTSGSPVTPKISTCYASALDNFATCTSDLAATNLSPCANATQCTEAYTFTPSADAINGYEIDFDCDASYGSGTACDIWAADVRVTPGVTVGVQTSPPAPELRPISTELAFCERYFSSSFPQNTAPANATSSYSTYIFSYATGSTIYSNVIRFPVTMRATPTIAYYSPSTGSPTNGEWQSYAGSNEAVTTIHAEDNSFAVDITATTSAGNSLLFFGAWTATAEL